MRKGEKAKVKRHVEMSGWPQDGLGWIGDVACCVFLAGHVFQVSLLVVVKGDKDSQLPFENSLVGKAGDLPRP